MSITKPICFVIMGYGKKTDPESGRTLDLDKTYKNIIEPAVIAAGYQCLRGDEIQESGIIDKSMYAMLIYSNLVIADISTFNPNAIYELGIRHAARPRATIILKESGGKLPFDLNHSKIFHYHHQGDDISATESKRCIEQLSSLINSVSSNNDVDSPLYEYLKSTTPIELTKEDYTGMIKSIVDKQEHVFGLSEQAKIERDSGNFELAAKLWHKAHLKIESETYFIQQEAFCTYMSKSPSEGVALTDALTIINKLNPSETNDPETLGLTGAIYKRMWLLNGDQESLKRAIEYYKKGFQINSDYYTGENYALCLEMMAEVEPSQDEKTYYVVEARRTRSEILSNLKDILAEENSEIRIDIKWIYATYSQCNFAKGEMEMAEKYEALFFQNIDAEWEKNTYLKSKGLVLKIHRK